MKVIAITQARSGSTRLPNKILKVIQGKTLLEIHTSRVLKSTNIDKLVVATTTNPQDEVIANLCDSLNITYFRGSEDDVLDRFYQSVKDVKPDYIVRLTSDCPLIDGKLIDEVIEYTISNNLDYCSNTLEEMFPDGQDIEVFKFSVLEKAWYNAKITSEREHVTPYIYNNSSYRKGDLFKSDNYNSNKNFSKVRLTVDELVDFEVLKRIVDNLGDNKSWEEYTEYYLNDKEINRLNGHIIRNEGYLKSLKEDKDE